MPFKKLRLFLLLLCGFSSAAFAQDSTRVHHHQPDTAEMKRHPHELGVNTTLLLKQVFNLSNNTLPMLPYDITYKYIMKKSALRFGIGLTVDFSSSSTTNSVSNTQPSPDPISPTYNRSAATFMRAGWEWRTRLARRFLFYYGADLAGQYGMTEAQTITVFNNLPNNYSYSKTNLSSSTAKIGGGPVAGLQWFAARRISIATEVPLYVMYSHQRTTTQDFEKNISFGNEQTDYNTESETITGLNVALTLPVTLYAAFRF